MDEGVMPPFTASPVFRWGRNTANRQITEKQPKHKASFINGHLRNGKTTRNNARNKTIRKIPQTATR